MAQVLFIRHGQASFGSDNYDELSKIGHQQSVWLGEYLANKHLEFDGIYCGSLVRHKQTLEGILSTCPQTQEITVDERLNEFPFFEIAKAYIKTNPKAYVPDTAPRSEFYRLLRKAVLAWQAGELDESLLPESWSDFSKRTSGFIDDIVASPNRQLLVVSSGGAIGTMLQYILSTPPLVAMELNLQIRNASITRCYFGKRKMQLAEFNQASYLEIQEREFALTYS